MSLAFSLENMSYQSPAFSYNWPVVSYIFCIVEFLFLLHCCRGKSRRMQPTQNFSRASVSELEMGSVETISLARRNDETKWKIQARFT
ncbi:hypothetical protein M758_9G076800 [Ceratodon purpureus]|uniref:Uncharacterized protein n=1 Tax=Ceratodon purpureus TaxID=3225 RepID=A0A8T0GWT6_CERPU|nr:hypothetical protein KC19_9G177600 [Ceratodon purpureus]KAG0605649.1 hypothetical protein M758_9G076800 [Ceratodon purpureus]